MNLEENMERYAKKIIFILLCAVTMMSLTSCAMKAPIMVSFGLTETHSLISEKFPMQIGVNKFSEAKSFSLDLKNVRPPIMPKGSLSDGFTDSFVQYLHKTNLFEVVLKEPFDNDDVALILNGKILDIQTEEPDFALAMGGAFIRGLTIVGQLVPQYQKIIGTVELELAVNTRKGKLIKTYKEKTSTTNEVQTLGVGTTESFERYSKRPDIMESMTKTFKKLVDNLIRDKEEVLAATISEAK
jgi:hypothetical protein